MDLELKRELDRINQKLTTLLQERRPKPCWVRAKIIMQLTGWNGEEMRQARENGYIQYKEENGLWYDLESLPKVLIRNLKPLEVDQS
jgi:hypothetical protein